MKTGLKRLISLVLVVVIAASSFGVAAQAADDYHVQENFKNLQFERYDLTNAYAVMDDIQTLMTDTKNWEEVSYYINQLYYVIYDLQTYRTFAYIRYTQDITNETYDEDYQYMQSEYSEYVFKFRDIIKAVLKSSCGDLLSENMTQETVDSYLNDDSSSTSVTELLADETELQNEYNTAVNESYTVNIDGMNFSKSLLPQLYSLGSITYDEYVNYMTEIYQKENAAVGKIFLELLSDRTKLAKALGKDSYIDYMYESYGRDYSAEETEELCAAVKKYIVPIYTELAADVDSNAYYSVNSTPEEKLSQLTKIIDEQYPDLGEALDYMLQYDMYDIAVSDTKQDTAYTTEMVGFGAPFLFMNPTGTFWDFSALTHEFGHYYASYTLGFEDELNSNIDVSEIHSNSLELLFTNNYEELFGTEQGRELAYSTLIDALNGVIQGCMINEFESEVYSDPDMTLTEMNKLYNDLIVDYGLGETSSSGERYSWVEISHIFLAPMYYISYAVSEVPALEIWSESLSDPEGATEAYEELVASGYDSGYLKLLEQCDLDSPFDEATISGLADTLEENISELKSMPFTDLNNHWAKTSVEDLYRLGVINGTTGTSFSPNNNMTRGMLVTVLGRLMNADTSATSDFTDVDKSIYYSPYVAWAQSENIVSGIGSSLFAPQSNVTREQLAKIICNYLTEYGYKQPNSSALTYADSGSISTWAQESVSVMEQTGIMTGKSGSTFAPKASATRAEVCTAISRMLDYIEKVTTAESEYVSQTNEASNS